MEIKGKHQGREGGGGGWRIKGETDGRSQTLSLVLCCRHRALPAELPW